MRTKTSYICTKARERGVRILLGVYTIGRDTVAGVQQAIADLL